MPSTTGDSAAVAPVSGETTAAPASNQPLTTVALSESNFDFGKIKKGDKVEHVYEITNTGTNPLIISEVKPGCGCTAPDFTKDRLCRVKKERLLCISILQTSTEMLTNLLMFSQT